MPLAPAQVAAQEANYWTLNKPVQDSQAGVGWIVASAVGPVKPTAGSTASRAKRATLSCMAMRKPSDLHLQVYACCNVLVNDTVTSDPG